MRPVPRYLGLMVLLAMAGFAGAGFISIRKGIEDLREISQDNIVWSASQLEIELLRFQLSLARLVVEPTEEVLEDVKARFDIFWSRMALINNGRVGELMRGYDVEHGTLDKLKDYTLAIDQVMAELEPGDAATVERLLQEIQDFHGELRQYTLRVVRGDTSNQAMIREGIQENAQIAAGISLAAVLVSVLSLALILRENLRQREAVAVSRRSAEEAVLANRAKSRFLSMMSHELRNPLNGILGPLALLDQGEIATRQKALVMEARRCGQSMLQMLGGLLDYAEMQDGQFELQLQPFKPRALADALRGSLAAQGAGRLAIHVAQDVPDRVHGDQERYRQIFLNLCEFLLEAADPEAIRLDFDHDGQALRGRISFRVDTAAMDWKLDLLTGLGDVAPDQVSADALRPLISQGLIAVASGRLTLQDDRTAGDGVRAIEVRLPATLVRLERMRVYLETRSVALATLYQATLKSDRIVFAEPGSVEPVDVVLVDSTSVGEESLMTRLRTRFPGALFVSLGSPQIPDFFDDVLETPGDMGQLRSSILGRLAS